MGMFRTGPVAHRTCRQPCEQFPIGQLSHGNHRIFEMALGTIRGSFRGPPAGWSEGGKAEIARRKKKRRQPWLSLRGDASQDNADPRSGRNRKLLSCLDTFVPFATDSYECAQCPSGSCLSEALTRSTSCPRRHQTGALQHTIRGVLCQSFLYHLQRQPWQTQSARPVYAGCPLPM